MAQPISCDVCHAEQAVMIMTMLDGSESPAVGAVCLPVFLGAAVLSVTGAGEHRGLPQKCQACRRVHERMTLAATADRAAMAGEQANVRDQPGPAAAQDSPPIDRDKCPSCKAGVIVPELGVCMQCAGEHGVLPSYPAAGKAEGA